MWRSNLYEAKCCVCQQTLPPQGGFYRINAMSNRVFYCFFHKEEYDENPHEPIAKAPRAQINLVTPAVDIDALAQRTADLTYEQVAAHWGDKVVPIVEASLPAMVRAELTKLVKVAEIKVGKSPSVKIDQTHKMLPTVLQALVAGASPFLVGPAGSGKTTLAEQIANVLKLKFYCEARVTSEFKLMGFVDAHGKTVRTQFREAYEHGAVFGFDEVDASDPDALTGFNSALANGYCPFPDGIVKRHKDFYAIAMGNTFGRGADRQYVGRNQLDAATLDRFQVFEIDYDEDLEHELAGDIEWSTHVQRVRAAILKENVRHIVSPRASIIGARMLASGMDRHTVEVACIWKGLAPDAKSRVEYAMVGGTDASYTKR